MKHHPAHRWLSLTLSLFVMLTVSACDDQDGEEALSGVGYMPPLLEDLPSCERIYGILGDFTVGLVPDGDDENDGPWEGPLKYGVSCAWVTEEALSGNPFEAIKASGVAVQIIVEEHPLTGADYRQLGMIVADQRVAAISGLLVVPGGELDLAKPLSVIGPAVVVGRVYIGFAAGGAFLGRSDGVKTLTNDSAVEAGVALHRALAESG